MSSEIAEQVSLVPQLYKTGRKSTAALLKDLGFPQTRHSLSVDDVEDVLRRHPPLADLWLQRAADQRYAGGWGIERGNGIYRVHGYSDQGAVTVQDRTRACAEFVVRYTYFIGEVLARWH